MTRQNNEDSAVSEGGRKTAQTHRALARGGEKGVPVEQQTDQLCLFAETAENGGVKATPASTKRSRAQHGSATLEAPQSANNHRHETSATMEGVVSHLREAFQKVKANRGAPGPDGQSVQEVQAHLDDILPELGRQLLNGTYMPGAIRRVWIPKANGGRRGLGIPNVIDRVVQEAVRRALEPLYEPTFHASSHGFRPGRSCHTAVKEAREHVEEGHEWVVDLDLKSFFDRVGHQRLMAKLGQRVKDVGLLRLIHRWLRADLVMPDGVRVSREQGVPQGGPLSPLLSNIVLDEFDRELERRGHRFARYADDCNVYVRSKRSGERVMASLTGFLQRRLRLEVNLEKSAVARTEERHFVGFTLRREPLDGTVHIGLSRRSRERIDDRVRELTPRNWGQSLRSCITQLNEYLRGWYAFFAICTSEAEREFQTVDAHIRRRLRAIQLKHWKRRRTTAHKLIALGVRPQTAWRAIYKGRRSTWKLSHVRAIERGLSNAYFADAGLVSLAQRLRDRPKSISAPAQLSLSMG